MWKQFPIEYQMDSHDCGPAALKMVAKYFGKYYSLQSLRDKCGITKEGVSLRDISTGAESIGLRTLAIKCNTEDLVNRVPFPAILFWNENHFVVIYKVNRRHIFIADPMKGRVKYNRTEFEEGWLLKGSDKGVILALEPTTTFADTKAEIISYHTVATSPLSFL